MLTLKMFTHFYTYVYIFIYNYVHMYIRNTLAKQKNIIRYLNSNQDIKRKLYKC